MKISLVIFMKIGIVQWRYIKKKLLFRIIFKFEENLVLKSQISLMSLE